MRAWFRLLLLLGAAVALAVWLREHGGNVILAVPPWRVQFSTTLAVLGLIALFVAVHLGLRALRWLLEFPARVRHWRGQRAQQRDHDLLERGWIALAEGDGGHAERDFARLIAQTRIAPRKVIAALAAARAAHAQHQPERCQTFLTTAQDYMGRDPALQRAVAVTSAELLLAVGRPADALARLDAQLAADPSALSAHSPANSLANNPNATDATSAAAASLESPELTPQQLATLTPHLARLRLRALDALGQHAQTLALARHTLRRGWLARDAATALIERAGAEVLRHAVLHSQPLPPDGQTRSDTNNDGWLAVWKTFKTEERVLARVALVAAAAFTAAEQPDEAARIIEAAVKHRMTPELLVAYARCDAAQVSRRLNKAQTWLDGHPDDPDLLCALATLCLSGQIWGAAERHLQRSLRQRADARAHALLGSLYDRLDRGDDARRHWQQAAALGMVLPVLAHDAALPAADTHADPAIPDAALPADPHPEPGPESNPDSAVNPTANRVAPDSTAARPAPAAAAWPRAGAPRADIEELFDSAPIPVPTTEPPPEATAASPR